MKTILKQIKSLIQNAPSLSYVKRVEICAPKLLPDISQSVLPWVGIAPVNTGAETWIGQKKQVIHTIDVYIVNMLEIRESAVIGDTIKKGVVEAVEDVLPIIRSQRFLIDGNYYLSKPMDTVNIDYVTSGYGDSIYLLVASIQVKATRLFDYIALP